MNTHTPNPAATCSTPAPSGADGEAAVRHARNLAFLDRMIEVGMASVEAIGRQVTQGPPPVPAPSDQPPADAATPPDPARFHSDLALAFSRASRTVRLCMTMQNRLIEQAEIAARQAPARAQLDALSHGPGRRATLARIVERRARAHHEDEAAIRRLVHDAAEQLADRESFGHLLGQPLEAVIDQICRDLGLPNEGLPTDGLAPAPRPAPATAPTPAFTLELLEPDPPEPDPPELEASDPEPPPPPPPPDPQEEINRRLAQERADARVRFLEWGPSGPPGPEGRVWIPPYRGIG